MVSVLIPAYNAESTIGAAISSALSQTYPQIEVVVVDDGSTDRTAAIAAAYGPRVTLVEQANLGLSAARNAAIAAARGDIFSLLDADDVLLPQHIDAQYATLLACPDPRSWVTSEAFTISARGLDARRLVLPVGVVAAKHQLEAIVTSNFATVFSMFPRAMVEEVGGFDTALQRCEDWHLWARAIASGWVVATQPLPTAMYFLNAQSLSSDADVQSAAEDRMLEMFEASHGDLLSAHARDLLRRRLHEGPSERWRVAGAAALRAGDASKASHFYRRAAVTVGGRRRYGVLAWALRLPGVTGYLRRRRVALDDDRERIAAARRRVQGRETGPTRRR